MSELANRKCVPCRGGVPPMAADAANELLRQLSVDWKIVANHHLERDFKFPDFKTALEFVNRVGEIAEREEHHPDIHLAWGKVKVVIWTHKIDGLTESDFILAAKIDEV